MKDIFGRIESQNVRLFHSNGEACNQLDTDQIFYDSNTGLGLNYDHPEGIVITKEDVKKLQIELE